MAKPRKIETFLSTHLKTRFIGKNLHYFPSVTSTMDVAKEIAEKGAADGTIIIAGKQETGRGRLGRSWLSPEGSLALSVILKPSLEDLPLLTMMTSLAVVKAIKKVTGIEAKIKWPNDVLISDKKVCGILIESEVTTDNVMYAIAGIGINVNFDTVRYSEIAIISTSLSTELGKEISIPELTAALLTEIENLYTQIQDGQTIHLEWQKQMETLGKEIQIHTGQTIEQGIAEAVTQKGNLILRRKDGSLIEIVAGDVTLLKN